MIHETLKKSLAFFNIICDRKPDVSCVSKNISCVDTFYKDDLFLNGRKIAGSCQRRRGKRILIEGSLHLEFDRQTIEKFSEVFFKNAAEILNCEISVENLTENELHSAARLADSKYNADKWSRLF
jgi:lipoate-protein ligase A